MGSTRSTGTGSTTAGGSRRHHGRATAGLLAGAAGTLAMDLWRYREQQRQGDPGPFPRWEISTGQVGDFEHGGETAEVGRRLAGRLGVALPDRWAGPTADAVHWSTGLTWGLVTAVVTGRALGSVRGGVWTGALAFATSYAVLGSMGLYQPIWRYDLTTLRRDLASHLVYGATTGAGLAALNRLHR